ncbi:sensor histidine kinase [Pedobacter nanyangensis]|uniref:sensor histidine kinase n=1 Tax=Pedobacter nanyangensis TaxID=1562389 RepID=UPI000DE3602D|nr:histidine kinase [Pedobacter nanyangensis]
MPQTERTFLSNKAKRAVFVPLAFVLFYLVSFLLDPYATFWQEYFQRSFWKLLTEWMVSLVFCFLVSEASIFIHSRLNRTLPWTDQPLRRLMTEALFNMLAVMVIIFLDIAFIVFIEKEHVGDPSTEDIKNLMQWGVVSTMISFTLIAINTGSHLAANWKSSEMSLAQHKLREAELKQASVEAQLNALKLQLDPHFIFNSLSILSELILEDQQLGYEYSERFSRVYRFLLVNSKKNTVSLEEELKFLDSYIFLIKHRIGSGVTFDIDVAPHFKSLYLPPLTLQLLIENALKHNSTNKNSPLNIRIYTKDIPVLVVENSLSLIENQNLRSFGIGLPNIMNRFQLLQGKLPEIVKDAATYKVIIHLMDYEQ